MIEIPLPSAEGESHPGTPSPSWEEVPLPHPWRQIIRQWIPDSRPSDIQLKALVDAALLSSRRNLLVSAATNSGKSLIGYLGMLQGVIGGGRVLLLEPLRAIAQEKYDELVSMAEVLEGIVGRKIGISITTGDYRLDEESMQSPPPLTGEIVIATPERIEAILRNPDFDTWSGSFRVVCVDEAHLVADPVRGATLEYVITSFKLQTAPPRMILLSATLGDPAPLVRWLDPCDVVYSSRRRSRLERSICVLENDDDPLQCLASQVGGILEDPHNSVLIFVYQTRWAASLALQLQQLIGNVCGPAGAAHYHSRMSAASKATVRRQFMNGETRCVVSTAALAMGVNLPATHVIVRDLSYAQGESLPASVLQQMTGRAGRGDQPGKAILMLRSCDSDNLPVLKSMLETTELPRLRSVFGGTGNDHEPHLSKAILSLLSRRGEQRLPAAEIAGFIRNTLDGVEACEACEDALKWLRGPTVLLAHRNDDDEWIATRLGRAAIKASLPLQTAAGIAQLMRDLMTIDESDGILESLGMLDLLLLVEMTARKSVLSKAWSESIADQVEAWATGQDSKSLIFQQWIRGKAGFSKADEIAGSLGLEIGNRQARSRARSVSKTDKVESARVHGYQSMLRAIILWQKANGVLSTDLERRWKIKELDEILESWRDDRLFLIGSMANLWDLKCFYYHLREECKADDERIHRVKRAFQRLRGHSMRLMNLVSWCSPLGPAFLRLRASMQGRSQVPARETMRKLELAGFNHISMLRSSSVEELGKLGIRRDLAECLIGFSRRS
jgi:helicase